MLQQLSGRALLFFRKGRVISSLGLVACDGDWHAYYGDGVNVAARLGGVR